MEDHCHTNPATVVGQAAPDFDLQGYFKGELTNFKLSDYKGKWVYLLFYPLDFTFVCPTEVLAFSSIAAQLEKKNCALIGISVDSQFTHKAWVESKREDGGLGGSLNYPLLSDLQGEASWDYGVSTEDGVALRGLFLIDPEGVVMHATINNLPVGRNASEAVRTLDAFQFVASNDGQVCPANWTEGEDSMDANPDGMREYLTSHE